MLPGAKFFRIYSTDISEDGQDFCVWLELDDGSLRAVHWPLNDLIAMSGEISEPTHAPRHALLQ